MPHCHLPRALLVLTLPLLLATFSASAADLVVHDAGDRLGVPPDVAATPPRWDDAFAAFAAADRAAPPPPGGVLFVGSSSIRLWQDLEQQFKTQPVVLKRGFGGSRLADCVTNLNRLVIRYQPRLVLLYAGDNDIASGSTPQDVLRRFVAFERGVHAALPATRIAYISIKPSPARSRLLPVIHEANALIHAYVADHAGLEYIDVYGAMLDDAGHPRTDLFRPDLLHLNVRGYALWQRLIAPYVAAPADGVEAQAAAAVGSPAAAPGTGMITAQTAAGPR
jgi:lysophospholipase L1-like esterase